MPAVADGASTAAFSESATTLSRAARSVTAPWARSDAAVAAEPVNAMLSWPPRQSSRPASSPGDAQTSCSEPSGIRPDSITSRTAASARYAVAEAGLMMAGTPAMKAGASFSSIPQTGKLNALICNSTPLRAVRM